ncbi:MAG: cell division protein FtsK [Ramlibacter sp.]|nr:cell division protein FtsK [Ramlibacter sp.]
MADNDQVTPPEASEPEAGKVVDIAAGKRKASKAAAAASSSPPPKDGASAQSSGKGAKPKKPEKTIDWGQVNYLLEKFALIYGTDTVWDGDNRLIMKISNMAHAHGSDFVKIWKGHERRRTVMPTDVVFDPTQTCGEQCVNLFGGIKMEPKEGDVQPMLELLNFLTSRVSSISDECGEVMHWLLKWMAFPLQHVGAKMRTAVIMHGDEGAGKNFLFDRLVEIYGEYGALVGQDELEDKFNDWRSRKLFIIGDEVSSRQELVHNKNRLKALITSPTVQINPKNLPRREEANHINVCFLSNELQPLALDNSDRRYLVIYTPRMRERAFYLKLKDWAAKGGVEAFYHYLLQYPLEDFDESTPAPVTEAKKDLIDLNRKSPERFWIEWASGELDLPYRSCSCAQAYRAYEKYAQRIGDRYPMQRNVFTRMVMRISETGVVPGISKPVREKVMKVGQAGIVRKAMRMLLVTDPPDDAQGDWATETVNEFDEALKRYVGYGPRSPLDGDEGGKAGS